MAYPRPRSDAAVLWAPAFQRKQEGYPLAGGCSGARSLVREFGFSSSCGVPSQRVTWSLSLTLLHNQAE